MDRQQIGLDIFHELLPDVQNVGQQSPDSIAPELGNLSLEYAFGTLWSREGLDRRSRSLVTLGILIALRASKELSFHFQIAMTNGLSKEEIDEVIYHATAYAGFPAASEAANVAKTVLKKEEKHD